MFKGKYLKKLKDKLKGEDEIKPQVIPHSQSMSEKRPVLSTQGQKSATAASAASSTTFQADQQFPEAAKKRVRSNAQPSIQTRQQPPISTGEERKIGSDVISTAKPARPQEAQGSFPQPGAARNRRSSGVTAGQLGFDKGPSVAAASEVGKFSQPVASSRTRSNAQTVIKRAVLAPVKEVPDPKENPMNQSVRFDKKINNRVGSFGESQQPRPSMLSARRQITADEMSGAMLAERGSGSEDSDTQHPFDKVAKRVDPKNDALGVDSFQVVASPDIVPVPKSDHFSMKRAPGDAVRGRKDWTEAMEDSEEEFAEFGPLETIVPAHLQKKELLKGQKPRDEPQTALEKQMAAMNSVTSADSFEIGGRSTKPKSSTVSGIRPKVNQPSSGASALNNRDFGASLVKGNLESDALTGEADFRDIAAMENDMRNLDTLNAELAQANRRTATLQNPVVHNFSRRKQTVLTDDSGDTFESEPSSRKGTGREAIYRKSRLPEAELLAAQASHDEAFSSQQPSEKSYDSESDISLTLIEEEERLEELLRLDAEEQKEKAADEHRQTIGREFLEDLLKTNAGQKSGDVAEEEHQAAADCDMIALVNESEHLFIHYAQQKLAANRAMLEERAIKAMEGLKRKELIQQRVLTEVLPRNYGLLEAQFMAQRQSERDTCIAISDEVVVVGTQRGTFNAYNRETCRPYGRFADTSSEFADNAVTCMHIHPLRTEYLVVGFERGQIMIVDLSMLDKNHMLKPKKTVKDHHRGSSVVSIKFCDWYRERAETEERKGAPGTQDTQAWMIASVDLEGRVIITSIRDVALGILKASKFVLLDPRKQDANVADHQLYQVIEPRFFKMMYPQGEFNDSQTWLALGNRQEIQILQVSKETCRSCFKIRRPNAYPSERKSMYQAFPDTLPVMAWGYGRSPCFKHRTHAMLAVSWGALIQLILLIPDDERFEDGIDFRVDGQYFIAPGSVADVVQGTSTVRDLRIESMKFLSESVLFVYTSTHDIRVLHTQSFKNGAYEPIKPSQLEDDAPGFIFSELDSRLKLMDANSALTKEQRAIEMERRKFLSSPLISSLHGGKASQTLGQFEDWVVFITEAGFCSVQHMTWQEYVDQSEQDMDSTWIDTFQKTLDIFDGKLKGFKGVNDDGDLRRESMKAELKLLVTDLIDKLIAQWKAMALRMESSGQPQLEVVEHFQNKQRALIKRSIEMCVDIWEPFFLFNGLFQKFMEQDMQSMFAEELKPYILSGTFSNTDLSEAILVHHILKHPYERFEQQENAKHHNNSPSSGELSSQESPAESFEKIMVNLSFNSCSAEYQHTLLNFCKEKKLITGHFYLAVNHAGEDGIRVALHQMRTFYMQFKEEETLSSLSQSQKAKRTGSFRKNSFGHEDTLSNTQQRTMHSKPVITYDDLFKLKDLAADMHYREVYERSAAYIGYKLLWAIRLTLLGKRFPKGHYEMSLWQEIVHEVLDIITQEEFMKTLVEIDSSAFFQIITIAFNNPSVQYDFLLKGRGPQVNLMQDAKVSMSHSEIISRVSDYCLIGLPEGSEVRLQYLFFIASIAEETQELRDQAFYFKVTLELLAHHNEFMTFNRSLIRRQMTQKQMYRKLSRKGVQAPDAVKHVVLSEESIMVLFRKCEPMEREQIDQLVTAIAHTDFDSLKLMLYEKQEAYTQCLKLLLERESVSTFVTVKMRDRFAWILETYVMLETRLKSRTENTHNRYQFDLFEQEIFTFAHVLTRIDAHKAVGLVDGLFMGQDSVKRHLMFVTKMKDHPQEQYKYTQKLLEINIDQAKTTMTEYSLQQKFADQAEAWLKILNINLEMACQLEPDTVVQKIKGNLKQNFYPPEECLKICMKYERTEASAILCKSVGRYKESVQHYVNLVNQTINTDKNILDFKKELYELDKHIRVTLLKQKKQLADKEMEHQRRMKQNMMSSNLNLDVGNFHQLSMDIEDVLKNSRTDLIPIAYSKNFSTSELFVDAIQLKMFLSSNCPNVSLLERVIKILLKMMKSHPEELLRSNEEIWLLMIQMMFGLTQHSQLHRKRYCRRYLIVKVVTLVREMLKYVGLEKIINGVLTISADIKFRAVKQLVSNVFLDKRAEVDLCVSGADIAHAELKAVQSDYFETKADGLTFKYTKCDICGQNVSESSLRLVNSVKYEGQKEPNLIIFDCSKENYYNHAYHERCLTSAIKEELRKDKKASLKGNDLLKQSRCVICYKYNQNILNMTGAKPTRPGGVTERRARPGRGNLNQQRSAAENTQNMDTTSEKSSQSDYSQRSIHNRSTQMIKKTFEEEQQERIYQKLNLFDKNMDEDTLQADNFTML